MLTCGNNRDCETKWPVNLVAKVVATKIVRVNGRRIWLQKCVLCGKEAGSTENHCKLRNNNLLRKPPSKYGEKFVTSGRRQILGSVIPNELKKSPKNLCCARRRLKS
jgi:hypothetical protein